MAGLAIHIEVDVIRETVGSQDQISAAYGGFNRIEFRRDGGFEVQPVILPPERLASLSANLMLVFTGFARLASEVAKSKIDNLAKRGDEIRRMTAMVDEGLGLLSGPHPIADFGPLLHAAWPYTRPLSAL